MRKTSSAARDEFDCLPCLAMLSRSICVVALSPLKLNEDLWNYGVRRRSESPCLSAGWSSRKHNRTPKANKASSRLNERDPDSILMIPNDAVCPLILYSVVLWPASGGTVPQVSN